MMIRKSFIICILIIIISGCSSKTSISSYTKKYDSDTYFGYLTIKKINLRLGFYPIDSPLNNVNKNIALIKNNIPNTYIIAGHSGTGYLAYFNNLKYLEIGDELILEFKNKTNHYKIENIRKEIKDGTINIKNIENYLILTTCDQESLGYQLIIEGKLI